MLGSRAVSLVIRHVIRRVGVCEKYVVSNSIPNIKIGYAIIYVVTRVALI